MTQQDWPFENDISEQLAALEGEDAAERLQPEFCESPAGPLARRTGQQHPAPPGRKPCEFVSPKLRCAEGVAEVERAIEAINQHGAKVNPACGLHITIEWNGDAAALARLISLVGNYERAIFASTGTAAGSRRSTRSGSNSTGTRTGRSSGAKQNATTC
jgi:hypothetical protein